MVLALAALFCCGAREVCASFRGPALVHASHRATTFRAARQAAEETLDLCVSAPKGRRGSQKTLYAVPNRLVNHAGKVAWDFLLELATTRDLAMRFVDADDGLEPQQLHDVGSLPLRASAEGPHTGLVEPT